MQFLHLAEILEVRGIIDPVLYGNASRARMINPNPLGRQGEWDFLVFVVKEEVCFGALGGGAGEVGEGAEDHAKDEDEGDCLSA